MADLLVELRTEEIPAGYLDRALDAWRTSFAAALEAEHLTHGDVTVHGTPRRMALHVVDLATSQPDRVETAVGPAERAAFGADGKPTKAAEGFARSNGVAVDALEVRDTKKGRYVCVEKRVGGSQTVDLLPRLLTDTVSKMPFPKRMRWVGKSFTFARPVRGVVALFGPTVLDWTLAGIAAGNRTAGHPFLAPESIDLDDANLEAYQSRLGNAYVIVDRAARREAVDASLAVAAESAGGTVRDDGLVQEVANMVEYPGVLTAQFEERFLELPPAVIEAVLRNHQRYFSVRLPDGTLTNRFLSVVDRPESSFERIADGNERVVRARLVDGEFFLAEDKKTPLADRRASLDQVVFLKGLGTIGQRVDRLKELARKLSVVIFGAETADRAERAASLCKSDLVTQMVFEFPELQGVIGETYARAIDGEEPEVAAAIREHYLPQGPEDDLPATPTGTAVALADRLDLLTGCFLRGFVPTGSRDPYGLRRATLGIIRMLGAGELRIDISKWMETAASGYDQLLSDVEDKPGAIARLEDYVGERVQAHFVDKGYPHELVQAAAATAWGDIVDLGHRLEALQSMRGDERFDALIELVERTKNISKRLETERTVRPEYFSEGIEGELFEAYATTEPTVREAFANGDFVGGSIRYLEGLGPLLHRYFDEVYVNDDDARVRANRLSMLRQIHRLYRDHVADLSLVPRTAGGPAA